GVNYIALNGGPAHQLSEAVSLTIECDDQAEIDRYWEALSQGGKVLQCGWLTDRFGLTWQVVPSVMPKLMFDPKRAPAVMQALHQMVKLDIAKLQAAFDGAA